MKINLENMSRPSTRSQTKKRKTQEKEEKFQTLVTVSEENREEQVSEENVLEGLTFSRDKKHVKIDENLLKKLVIANQVEKQIARNDVKIFPFKDSPIFLQTMKTGTPLTLDFINSCSVSVRNNPLSMERANLIGTLPLDWLALQATQMLDDNWEYNVKVTGNPHVTDQERSGNCWLHSTLGTMRYALMTKLRLNSKFEFSTAYLYFYDKIERANLFFEYVWNMRHEDPQDPKLRSIGTIAYSDGGHFMFTHNLLKKFGIVPKSVYKSNLNIQITVYLNETLEKIVKHISLEIQRHKDVWNREYFEIKKEGYNKIVYDLLIKFMGQPPKPTDTFTWTYKDVDEETHTMPNLTPEKFFRVVVPQDIDNVMIIIHDPRHPETYFCPCYSEYSVNMVGGQPRSCINLPEDIFKKVIYDSLKNDTPVYFACDMGKCFDGESNTSDPSRFNYSKILGINMDFSKADELDAFTSYPNHAMLFNGVDTEEDKDGNVIKYNKWRVENSWGGGNDDESPDHNYHRMTDSYFSQFVYEAAVNLNYFPPEIMEKILQNTREGKSYTYKYTDALSSESLRAPCPHCNKKNSFARPSVKNLRK